MICYWCCHSERILQWNFRFPFLFLSHKRRCCLKNVCNAEKLFDKSSRVTMLTPGTIRGQLAGTETLWWMGRAIRSDQNMSSWDSRRIIFRAKWPSAVPCIITSPASGLAPWCDLPHPLFSASRWAERDQWKKLGLDYTGKVLCEIHKDLVCNSWLYLH